MIDHIACDVQCAYMSRIVQHTYVAPATQIVNLFEKKTAVQNMACWIYIHSGQIQQIRREGGCQYSLFQQKLLHNAALCFVFENMLMKSFCPHF